MKKNHFYALTLLFAIISLGIGSCSKEQSYNNDDDSNYYVKFQIDSAQKEFKANLFAAFNAIDLVGTTIYNASFQGGLASSSSTGNLMGINIRDMSEGSFRLKR